MRNLSLEAAVADTEARYVAANPKSKARFEAATRDMPGGNTRTVLHYDPFPVALIKGEGAYLTDLDGHSYTDFLGEFTAGLYGHSEPEILRGHPGGAVGGLVLGGPNRYEARLAELMCAALPGIGADPLLQFGLRVTLMSLSLRAPSPGAPRSWSSMAPITADSSPSPAADSPINVPFPYVMADYNDMEGTRQLIGQHAQSFAAIIIEPTDGQRRLHPRRPGVSSRPA